LLLLSAWLSLATGAFTYVTNNAAANGLALLPLILLTAWLAFHSAAFAILARWTFGPVIRTALAVLVFTLSAYEIWNFNAAVNDERAMTRYNPAEETWTVQGPMQFARFQDGYSKFDIRDILPYIESRAENFLVYGDSIFLYGATGHPSVFPALWYHWGLTMPSPESEEFASFDERVAAHLAAYDVRYIIEERGGVPMGAGLENFKSLARLVEGCSERKVGEWTVREICN